GHQPHDPLQQDPRLQPRQAAGSGQGDRVTRAGALPGAAAARIAAVLGHELRNPLGAALANAALACELVDAADPRRRVLEAIVRDRERLGTLVDGYLAFARAGAPRRDPVALLPLAAAIAARHPAVRVSVPAAAAVAGDALLLERALENLVDNALQ